MAQKTTARAATARRKDGNKEENSKNAEKVRKISFDSRVPDKSKDHQKIPWGQI